MPSDSPLRRALGAGLPVEISRRLELLDALEDALDNELRRSEERSLELVVQKPGSEDALAIAGRDVDLFVWIATIVGAAATMISGAPVAAVAQIAVLLWRLRKASVHLSASEVAVVAAIKDQGGSATSAEVRQWFVDQDAAITESEVETVLLALERKVNAWGETCAVLTREDDRWSTAAY